MPKTCSCLRKLTDFCLLASGVASVASIYLLWFVRQLVVHNLLKHSLRSKEENCDIIPHEWVRYGSARCAKLKDYKTWGLVELNNT